MAGTAGTRGRGNAPASASVMRPARRVGGRNREQGTGNREQGMSHARSACVTRPARRVGGGRKREQHARVGARKKQGTGNWECSRRRNRSAGAPMKWRRYPWRRGGSAGARSTEDDLRAGLQRDEARPHGGVCCSATTSSSVTDGGSAPGWRQRRSASSRRPRRGRLLPGGSGDRRARGARDEVAPG